MAEYSCAEVSKPLDAHMKIGSHQLHRLEHEVTRGVRFRIGPSWDCIDRIAFELQDEGEFLLIQLILLECFTDTDVERQRIPIGEKIQGIFKSLEVDAGWMVAFVRNDVVIDSIYPDLVSGESLI